MARYGGFAEMSKAEHTRICRLATKARTLRVKHAAFAAISAQTLTYEQGVKESRRVICLQLRRFIREMEKE